MTDEPLKPVVFNLDDFDNCPCCGSRIDVSIVGGLEQIRRSGIACTTDPAEIKIFCPNCGIQSKPFLFSPDEISEAITAWNSRVEPDELPGWVKAEILQEIKRLKEFAERSFYSNIIYANNFAIEKLEEVLSLRRGDKP